MARLPHRFNTFLVAIFASAALIASTAMAAEQTALSLGTSSVGARFHILAVGLGDVVSRHSKLNVTVEPIGGSDANVRSLKAKRIDMALINSIAATHGHRGTGSFKKDGKNPMRLILQGGTAARVLVARTDRNIRTAADLRGKKVQGRRRALADLEVVLKEILKVNGVPESEVTILSHSDTNEQLESLKLGTADAVLMPYGSPKSSSPPVRRLAETIDLIVVDLDRKKIEKMLENPELGGFFPTTIQKDSIKGVDKPVASLGLGEYLVGRGDLSEDAVYQFTKSFFANLKDFHAVHASARDYTVDNSLEPATIPYHPGAIRYYKEIKRWNADMEKLQATLLK